MSNVDLKGTENITANGWKFWKYIDDSIGTEKFIEELREYAYALQKVRCSHFKTYYKYWCAYFLEMTKAILNIENSIF